MMYAPSYVPAASRPMWVATGVSAVGSADGLGKVFTVKFNTPFGTQSVSANVPYEAMAASALDELVAMIEAEMPRLLAPLLEQAGAYVSDVLWPSMQPKLRLELERLLKIAKAEAEKEVNRVLLAASFISGALLLGMVGTAIFLKKKRSA